MRTVRAALAILEQAVRVVGTACFVAVFVLASMQVILRYLFDIAPAFTEEFARYALVWAVFSGSALAVRHGSHISVTFLVDALPKRVAAVWWGVLDLAQLALFGFLVWTGIDAAVFAHGQTSAGLQVPLSYPYAGIPIFFAAAASFLIARRLAPRAPDNERT